MAAARPDVRADLETIRSRENAQYKACMRLAAGHAGRAGDDGSAQAWIEGEHLCESALAAGLQPALLAFSDRYLAIAGAKWAQYATKTVVFADGLWPRLSTLPSPAPVAMVIELPAAGRAIEAGVPTVVLDRLQDPGNAGSILRSAAAFGFRQVLALRETVRLWSPKVLRAGMGAHFALALHEGLSLADLDALQLPLLATSSHAGRWLHEGVLPWPCAWCFGHEGQGVSAGLAERATLGVRIAQPGGQESLNVAAAAAICLHASAVSRPGP